jgi:hypothetical protein
MRLSSPANLVALCKRRLAAMHSQPSVKPFVSLDTTQYKLADFVEHDVQMIASVTHSLEAPFEVDMGTFGERPEERNGRMADTIRLFTTPPTLRFFAMNVQLHHQDWLPSDEEKVQYYSGDRWKGIFNAQLDDANAPNWHGTKAVSLPHLDARFARFFDKRTHTFTVMQKIRRGSVTVRVSRVIDWLPWRNVNFPVEIQATLRTLCLGLVHLQKSAVAVASPSAVAVASPSAVAVASPSAVAVASPSAKGRDVFAEAVEDALRASFQRDFVKLNEISKTWVTLFATKCEDDAPHVRDRPSYDSPLARVDPACIEWILEGLSAPWKVL